MTTINTGGPAFPCDHLVDDDGVSLASGMTLRDYFAAKAMQALIERRGDGALGVYEQTEVAEDSYIMADGMLKARND